jgi:hypothetical protein
MTRAGLQLSKTWHPLLLMPFQIFSCLPDRLYRVFRRLAHARISSRLLAVAVLMVGVLGAVYVPTITPPFVKVQPLAKTNFPRPLVFQKQLLLFLPPSGEPSQHFPGSHIPPGKFIRRPNYVALFQQPQQRRALKCPRAYIKNKRHQG